MDEGVAYLPVRHVCLLAHEDVRQPRTVIGRPLCLPFCLAAGLEPCRSVGGGYECVAYLPVRHVCLLAHEDPPRRANHKP